MLQVLTTGISDKLGSLQIVIAKLDKSVEHQSSSHEHLKVKQEALELGLDNIDERLTTLEFEASARQGRSDWWSNNWHKIFQTAVFAIALITAMYAGYHRIMDDLAVATEAAKVKVEVTTTSNEGQDDGK